jgi:hypothetical protein
MIIRVNKKKKQTKRNEAKLFNFGQIIKGQTIPYIVITRKESNINGWQFLLLSLN